MIRLKLLRSLLPSILLLVLVLQWAVVAQTPFKADWVCTFDGRPSRSKIYFNSEGLAQEAVAKIIRYTGLVQNFVVAESEVANAMAFVEGQKRMILYNRHFIERISDTSKTDWAATGILAHEVGHHLLGHTIQSDHNPTLELDADRYAGFILQKMGAPIEQATAGWYELSEKASATHPARTDRVKAVKEGWVSARDLKPLSRAPAVRSLTRPNELWFITMSKASNYAQRYTVLGDLLDSKDLKANWDQDYYITSVARGNNRWVVIMDKGNPGYSNQTFTITSTIPKEWIREKWNENYEITAISYGGDSWVTVMTKGSSYKEQSYISSDSFPKDWVKENWDKGLRITSLAASNDRFWIIMSKASGLTEQAYNFGEKVDIDWIKAKWAQNFYITAVVKKGNIWAVVMAKGVNFTHQWYWLTEQFPSEWITQRWDEGYNISLMY